MKKSSLILFIGFLVVIAVVGFWLDFEKGRNLATLNSDPKHNQTSILTSTSTQVRSSSKSKSEIKNKQQPNKNTKQKHQTEEVIDKKELVENIKKTQGENLTAFKKDYQGEDNSETGHNKKTDTASSKQNKEFHMKKTSEEVKYFYNQAYIENFQADDLDTLLRAENSYILVDPFDNEEVSKNILKIKVKNNIVGCYISVGTIENWRDDFDLLKNNRAKKEWGDWEGEYFVAKIDDVLLTVMKNRINKMKSWSCDFVELDNMDWAYEENIKKYKLEISKEEAKQYISDLLNYIHSKKMKAMAKSTTLAMDNFDGLTVESYSDEKNWWSETEMKDILSKNKIGAIVHYNEKDCQKIKDFYNKIYGNKILFICEDRKLKTYRHFGTHFET